MLSRKYYVMIARTLLEARATVTSSNKEWTAHRLTGIDEVARLLASEFKADNGRFDRSRFLTAAGVEE